MCSAHAAHMPRTCRAQYLYSLTWEYQPADPCAGGVPPPFAHSAGFLPAGNDLLDACPGGCAPMTEAAAMRVCESLASCAGFTYATPVGAAERKQLKHTMHFKSSGVGVSATEGWHSWVRSKTAQLCGDANKAVIANLTAPLRLRVDVLRESPPVFVVHDFATDAECEAMMDPILTLTPTPILTLTLTPTLTPTLTLTLTLILTPTLTLTR